MTQQSTDDDTATRTRPTGPWAGWARLGGDRNRYGPPFWVLAIIGLVIGISAAVAGKFEPAAVGFAGALLCTGLHFGLNALSRTGARRAYGQRL